MLAVNLTRDPCHFEVAYSFAVLAMCMPSPALLLYSVMHNVLYISLYKCASCSRSLKVLKHGMVCFVAQNEAV